jgi:hypothetical protein
MKRMIAALALCALLLCFFSSCSGNVNVGNGSDGSSYGGNEGSGGSDSSGSSSGSETSGGGNVPSVDGGETITPLPDGNTTLWPSDSSDTSDILDSSEDQGSDSGPAIEYQPKNEITLTAYYGRSKLSSNERKIYDYIYGCLKENMHLVVFLEGVDVSRENLRKIINCIIFDNPDLISVYHSYREYRGNTDDKLYRLEIGEREDSYKTAAKLSEANAVLNGIIEPLKTKSDYDKVKGVHDWLCKNVVYDTEIVGKSLEEQAKSDSYNLYGAFVKKKGVCEAYAEAFQYAMYKLGVQCLRVSGVTDTGVNHVWNIVLIDNQYYHIDVTYDDPTWNPVIKDFVSYSYFCITETEMLADRRYSSEDNYPLPKCEVKAANYYIKENRYFLNADNLQVFADLLAKDAKAGHKTCSFRFSDAEYRDEVRKNLSLILYAANVKCQNRIKEARVTMTNSPAIKDLILIIEYN